MAYSLPDGTKIDQIIWDNQALYSASGKRIYSDKLIVPALYTGRLKILIYANNNVYIHGTKHILQDLTEFEENPYCSIQYYNKNKDFHAEIFTSIISLRQYYKGNIITEFNIPSKILVNNNKYYNAYYVALYLYYNRPTSSGNISAYLIWE